MSKTLNSAKAAGDFPLRSSLFWRMNNGTPSSTWCYLSQNSFSPDEMTNLVNKQVEYKSNAMTFLLYHAGDSKCIVNPIAGNPNAAKFVAEGGEANLQELARWDSLLQIGKQPGIYLVPTLFCGDDAATTRNEKFHDMFVSPMLNLIHPYAAGYNICIEATKSMNVAQMERLIAVCKDAIKFDPKPVGVHIQWNRRDPLPQNADFLMYEFSWHPMHGESKSVQQVLDEAQQVVDKIGQDKVWFQEMTLACESSRAREQTRALLERFPGIIGLPGPV